MKVDMCLLKDGGVEGFNTIFKEYSRFAFVAAYNVLQDVELAKDIVQEVFCKIWLNRAKLDPNKNVKYYIVVTSRNAAMDLKSHRSFDVVSDVNELEYIADHTTSVIEDSVLFKAVNELPLSHQSVFLLKYEFNKSAKEISKLTGLTVQTVRNYIHEALQTLRKNPAYAKRI